MWSPKSHTGKTFPAPSKSAGRVSQNATPPDLKKEGGGASADLLREGPNKISG